MSEGWFQFVIVGGRRVKPGRAGGRAAGAQLQRTVVAALLFQSELP